MRTAQVWSLTAALACCTMLFVLSAASAAEPRTAEGLVVLYTFDEPTGEVVRDRSGIGEPLDLQIDKPSAVAWKNRRLAINASTKIVSRVPATKLIDAVKKSGEITIEAWVKPQDDRQSGPARIVSLSADTLLRNFTLAQDASRYDVRFRTTATNENGLPSTATPEKSLRIELTHVVYTRSAAGEATIYLNGQRAAQQKIAGDLANWSGDFRLALANEHTGDRTWLGELHLVAIYARAISTDDVARNFAAGAPSQIDFAALLPPAVERSIDFVADVQPIFRKHCFECHGEGNEEGSLNLGVRERALEGGEGGPVIVRGKSSESPLVHLVAGVDRDRIMPPDGEGEPLAKGEIGILRAWIDQGAPWPRESDVLDPRTERARQHWAFQPLSVIEPPAVKNEAWAQTPIDRFILAKLQACDLSPTGPLDANKLIRRLYFDVIGLPPTPEEIANFGIRIAELQKLHASTNPSASGIPQSAIDEVVDRLLASRHYGERWGRHWLDIARYADSDGQEGDGDRPGAYHYRDFVIRALNDNMPFDQFVRWQIAGDEYEPQNASAIAATGFLTAGPNTVLEKTFLEEERLRNRYNELDDMLATLGTGMLGLTIGCARCHNHKYDAISAREYYRMLAALHSGDRAEVPLPGQADAKALAFRDFGGEPRSTWLFERADFYDRDQPVKLGFVEVLSRGRSADEYWQAARKDGARSDTTYQRKALAEWMTSADDGAAPLVARVIVNRVWQQHFGEGLVRTPSDFGARSEPPSHPELLEWLAHDFVEHGWKLKRLHRLILTSRVYQQGTKLDAASAKVDPENKLLWRMRPRRIEAEVLRDAMLAVSGTLNDQSYGPAFQPPIADEAQVARNLKSPYNKEAKDDASTRRRSVYMFHKRVIPYPLLAAFDRPDALQSCSRREATTVAPQALAILNDPFVRARSGDFAARLVQEHGDDNVQLVATAFGLALGRSPSDVEQTASLEFIAAQQARRLGRDQQLSAGDARRLALTDFCQTMFGLNEFLYVD